MYLTVISTISFLTTAISRSHGLATPASGDTSMHHSGEEPPERVPSPSTSPRWTWKYREGGNDNSQVHQPFFLCYQTLFFITSSPGPMESPLLASFRKRVASWLHLLDTERALYLGGTLQGEKATKLSNQTRTDKEVAGGDVLAIKSPDHEPGPLKPPFFCSGGHRYKTCSLGRA